MTHKYKRGVTHRGLLWAGGLAAVPLPPVAAFDLQGPGLPWEGGRADRLRAAAHIRNTRGDQAPATSARKVGKPRVKKGD